MHANRGKKLFRLSSYTDGYLLTIPTSVDQAKFPAKMSAAEIFS